MTTLFPNLQIPETKHASISPGPFASVAIERSLDKILDYQIPHSFLSSLAIGQRVRVPLGRSNKPQIGYVISIHPTTTHTNSKIKSLLSIDDTRILLPPTLLQ